MENYTLATIHVGLSHDFSRLITADLVDAFTKISGDTNPLHVDPSFAKERGYAERVVYGMLTASLYSTLVGVYLPGRNALLQEVETSFRRPVYIGDELTISGEVVEVNEGLKRISIKAYIVNQHGQKVSKATIKAGVFEG
ncbi:MaoC family dehydratase [Vibrio sp. Of7-15]|uniref:MaoC family dehydratase n=1 Tax=Vibrio sp. Of7-15 TaxID=2724879 RepID=UPI001EF2BE74|nr:MaoC family dehydratase [Vibrio sp. Of7-15]MCG7499642.1 MaoC family dehydratase [Vibrio sp. Of7-15]